MKNMKMFGPIKLLHNIEEAVLRVMDHLYRLKIMMWKWIVLSKKENKIILSYGHNFGFIVVGKLKLVALNRKISTFVLQYSILFLGLLLGIFFSIFPLQSCLVQMVLVLCVSFFPLQKKFQWEVFLLAAPTSWNDGNVHMFERLLVIFSSFH